MLIKLWISKIKKILQIRRKGKQIYNLNIIPFNYKNRDQKIVKYYFKVLRKIIHQPTILCTSKLPFKRKVRAV